MKILENDVPKEQVETMPFEQAKKVFYPEYESSAGGSLTAFKAFDDFLHFNKKIPDNLAIYAGNAMATFGGKSKKIGTEIMTSAYRNIDLANENYEKTGITIAPEDYDTWTYQGVAGATNFAAMIGMGLVNPNIAYAYAGVSSLAQTAEDGARQYLEENPDDEYFKEFDHTQEFAYGTVKAITNVALEKFLGGVGKQIGFAKRAGAGLVKEGFRAGTKQTAQEVGKSIIKGGASEFSTEFAQGATDTYFDYLLDRFDSKQEAKDSFWGNMKGYVVAGLLGGGFGGAGTVYYRPKGINIVKEELKGVVPEKDLDNVATAVFDKQADSFRDKFAIELTLSSELKVKHGDIYNQMQSSVVQQMRESGAYSDLSEAEFAQYASDTSSKFADQVLAESHKRKTWIEDVVAAKDISYRDGKLRFFDKFSEKQDEAKKVIDKAVKEKKEKTTFEKLKKIGISPEFASSFDMQGLMGVQDTKRGGGLFQNKKTAIDREDSLVEFFANEGMVSIDDPEAFSKSLQILENLSISDLNKSVELTDADYERQLDDYIEDYARVMGYDLSKMSYEEKVEIYSQMNANLSEKLDPNEVVLEESSMSDEDFKALMGDYLFQESTYDSQGKADITTPEFKEWFGDSKVVDENGEPLVVYHGTTEKFDTFNKDFIGKNTGQSYLGDGFYFTTNKKKAEKYSEGGEVIEAYLNMKKPFNISELEGTEKIEAMNSKDPFRELGFDGQTSGDIIMVKNPNQIKSVYNKGAFSKDSDNIYMQGKEKSYKGAYSSAEKAIEITRKADLSTLPHELSHFWLDNMWDYARSGQASSQYMDNFQVLEKYLGVKDNQFKLTRNQHEKFARSYEAYLLKGNLPNKVIGDSFDDYDKWLKRVYNDARALNVNLTQEATEWFDTMTTGELITPNTKNIVEKRALEKKRERAVNESIKDAEVVIQEIEAQVAPARQEPVQTDYKTSYLKSVEKTTGEQVEAGTTTFESEMKKANEIVEKDLERAKRIVEGKEQTSEVLTNAVYIAYDRFLKKTGNSNARSESLINQGLMLRRAGQEIALQRIVYENGLVNTPQYWARKVELDRGELIAERKGLTQKELGKKISDKTKEIVDNMPETGKAEFINKSIKELADDLGLLYQKDKMVKYDSDTVAYNEIYRIVNQQLGTTLTNAEAMEITRLADDMLADLENSSNGNGNPSVEYFDKYSAMETYANKLAPAESIRVLNSVVGRGNLLASIKSPLTNIISNTTFAGFQSISRRLVNATYDNQVDKKAIDDFKEYTFDIFKRTGFTFATMTPETIGMKTLGEKITHSEGDGWARRLGRLYQDTVYKWGLGWGDLVAKNFAFTDYASLMATKHASEEGMTPTELFNDVALLEPKTETGKRIREEAIDEALISTYQKSTILSETALKVRGSIGNAFEFVGLKGFGEAIIPFAMTPSNVAAYGIKAGFGGVLGIGREVANTIRTGKLSKPEKRNIDLMVANGLGLVLATAIASMIDEEDYMPPYSLADSKTRQLASKLGIPYNSVKIMGNWYSLDYLSVIGVPIVGLLNAKKEEGLTNKMFAYAKAGSLQATNLPFIGGVSDLQKTLEGYTNKSGEQAAKEGFEDLLAFTYSRSVPAIVSDVAKAIDPYERERTAISTQVPFLRETEDSKYDYTTGRKMEGSNVMFEILAGSRAKENPNNPVARELRRLNLEGQTPSLTTVTRRGLLSGVKNKEAVERDFAKQYADGVKKLISTSYYKRLDDEEKKDKINKIRSSVVSGLKKKYLKR